VYNLDFDEQHAAYETNQFDEYHPPEETLDRDPTKVSLHQVNKDFSTYFFLNLLCCYDSSNQIFMIWISKNNT
jgi:hypothetical protein